MARVCLATRVPSVLRTRSSLSLGLSAFSPFQLGPHLVEQAKVWAEGRATWADP